MNPELRRYLWLELTTHRLVGMPAVLATLFYLGYLLAGDFGTLVATWSAWAFATIAMLWGTRLAAESVQVEITAHTWDSQRMSALEPWPMTWGKLLGSTIFVWYGCALCAVCHLIASIAAGVPLTAVAERLWLLAACAVLAHASGLLASLLSARKAGGQRSGRGAGFYALGLLAAAPFLSLGLGAGERTAQLTPLLWYGHPVQPLDFVVLSATAFAAWAVAGVHRLMRAELQCRNGPWTWLAFLGFCMLYAAGFVPPGGEQLGDVAVEAWPRGPAQWLVASAVALVLLYVVALLEPKDPVALRRLVQALPAAQWRRIGELVPRWTLTWIVAAVVSALVLLVYPPAVPGGGRIAEIDGLVLTALGFALRDMGLIVALNLTANPRRADTAALVYLLVVYLLAPAILTAVGLGGARMLLIASPGAELPGGLVAPVLQAGLMWWLVAARWRRLWSSMPRSHARG